MEDDTFNDQSDDMDDDDGEEIPRTPKPPKNGAAAASKKSAAAKESEKKKRELITMGKAKGFLTYDEVNERCPRASCRRIRWTTAVGVLGDEDIEIVDAATQAEDRREERRGGRRRRRGQRRGRDRGQQEGRGRGRGRRRRLLEVQRPGSHVPAQDGTVSLLTREGEVEIAKRIEDGEHTVLEVILNSPSPSARSSISATSSGSTRSASRRSSRTPTTKTPSSTRRGGPTHLRLIDKVKQPRQGAGRSSTSSSRRQEPRRGAARRSSRPRSTRTRQEMVETLEEMRLNKKTIDQIVLKLQGAHRRGSSSAETARSSSSSEARASSLSELRKKLREIRDVAAAPSAQSRKKLGIRAEELEDMSRAHRGARRRT